MLIITDWTPILATVMKVSDGAFIDASVGDM